MDSWARYVLLACAGIVAFLVWKKTKSRPDPPPVTDLNKSCISIPSAGGFEKLCHTDAPYGTIGANVKAIKPGILPQHPSAYSTTVNGKLVTVEVHAFGLNYADCCIRWGLYASAKKFVGWPITPGFEFSGKVVWSGKDSTFKTGDLVFGVTMFGAYSTKITVPSHQLFPKPSTFSMSEAAAFLCTGFTAYYALFQLAAPTMLPLSQQSDYGAHGRVL